MEWKIALLAIGLLALGFGGIAIKLWAKKGGSFSGTCASQNPLINGEGESCSFCGRSADEQGDCDKSKG